MRLCLMIEGQEGVTWDDWVALARVCERSGLEGLFRSDHYLSGDGRVGRGSLDAWTSLAAIAVHTERIRLGTMVSPVTFRHPSLLARAAVTVDHVSNGRAELGLGAGWYELEHTAFGFPFPPLRERMELLEEQLEIVRRQWEEGDCSFAGRHYRLDHAQALPNPVQARMPLIVGGEGRPRSVAAAARWADEYNAVIGDPAECRSLRAALDAAAAGQGREPESLVLSIMTTCLVGTDEHELAERADRLAAIFWPDLTGQEVLARHRSEWIAGTVEQVSERLSELAAAGVERVMLQHLDHRDLDAVELIGAELAG